MFNQISELIRRIQMNERSKVTKSTFLWESRHKHIATIISLTLKK